MKIGVRVKRWGKSPPVVVVTRLAVRLIDCKAKYITSSLEHRAARPGFGCRKEAGRRKG
jgi:hypothetical protein